MGATEKDYSQRRLGGGKLYIAEIDDAGVQAEEEWFGITENLTQTIETEYITINNTEGCTTVEDSKILSKVTVNLAWDTKNISPVNIARAFFGTKTETLVTSGNEVQTLTAVAYATPYDFTKKFASNIVVKDGGDTITYVEGTDYTIDKSTEPYAISITSGGGITAGDEINLTYDYESYTDGAIEAMTKASLSAKLRFKMCNSQGYDYDIVYHKCNLSSGGDFALKASEDAGILSFTASVVKVPEHNSIFDVLYASKNS